jgi:CRP-like cAMP-binding protein
MVESRMSLLVDMAAVRDIPRPAVDRIEARSRVTEVRDGARIFAQGDPADAVYAIIAGPGRVRIRAVGQDSKGPMVEAFSVGDMFGEIAVMDGSKRTANAYADGNMRLPRIGAPLFNAALMAHAAFGRNLCAVLVARLARQVFISRGGVGAGPTGNAAGRAVPGG